MSKAKDSEQAWTVYDPENDNARHFDTENAAEERAEHARSELGIDVEVYPPGQHPNDDAEMVRCTCLDETSCGRVFMAYPSSVDWCPYCREMATVIEE